MFYILDALKKVERDRRRAHVPSLATMHAVPVERRPMWPWIVGGALAINALGFALVLALRPSPTTAVTPPAGVTASAPVTPQAAATDTPAPALATPTIAATPPPPVMAAPDAAATRAAAPPVERSRATRRAETPARSVPASPERAATRPAPARAAERAEPEPFKLEVLVYSEQAAGRAAYINGQRYVEGQRVDGRAVVESITSDSVVLIADGKRIVLKQQ